MRIEELRITNFQCFGPAGTVIRLSENLTSLVGANGSGKTAFLQALSRLFGVTSRERDVRRSDFHVSPHEEEEPAERTLAIEAILAFDELDANGNGQQHRAVPACFNEMAASENGDLKCRIRLNAVWTDDRTVDGDIAVERFWIHTLEADFTQDECSKLSSADRGHIQMVYVPAQRDAASQVTSFLRGRLWQAIDWSDDARRAVSGASEALQNAFGGEEAVAAISHAIENRWQEVHDGGTNATPLLQLIDARFEEVVRKVGVAFFPTEEGTQRDLSELSDGQRSLFHIALTAAILDMEQSLLAAGQGQKGFRTDDLPLPSLTILAIEEPENNLAPYYLSRIIGQVLDLAKLASAQAVVSSHSASILSRVEPDDVRYFRLQPGSAVTDVREIPLPEKADEAAKFVREAVRTHPELYFAQFVILGEGDSEEVVLPLAADACGYPIDPSFVAMVPLGGRHIDHFWKLLNGLNIPHATLLDLDLGRHGGGWGRIKNACLKLLANDVSERDLLALPEYEEHTLADLEEMHKLEFDAQYMNDWINYLRQFGVYFSEPLDLDMSLLQTFPDQYKKLPPGARGPRGDADEARLAVLGSDGDPDLCRDMQDDDYLWYRYLFMTRSKPATHLYALSFIDDLDLCLRAPDAISALLAHVNKTITPPKAR